MHIVIDARIRRASTGRPVDRLLEYLQEIDTTNTYTILLEPSDTWKPTAPNFTATPCPFKQFSFNPLQQVTYARMLRSLRPDLVFFTMTGQQPLFYFGKQITLTHDLTMLRYVRAGKLPKVLHAVRMIGYRLLFWAAHRKSKAIIVPSKFVQKDLAQHYPFARHKVDVIYEASEPPIKGRSAQPRGVRQPFLLHVGSPFPHKNIERLVATFEKLLPAYPDLQLVLAGRKEHYFESLIEGVIAQSSAKDNIVIPGFVSDAELKWLYEHAAMYVLPSLSEGFGLPGLEAMAHGCPLASSNATCLPEIYQDAALYFDPESVSDMTQKIEQLLRDPKLAKSLVASGHKLVATYSWERMTHQILDVFKKALR